ncbi:MAG: hypothetical protein AAF600_16570 [Bacteroidota bacterium]
MITLIFHIYLSAYLNTTIYQDMVKAQKLASIKKQVAKAAITVQ